MKLPRRFLEYSFVLLLFIILAFVLFGRTLVLPPGNMLFGMDSHSFLFFIFDYLVKTVKSGHIPWWNPYMFSGVPMLANPAGGSLFYPPNILFFVFPISKAIIAHFFVHIVAAGVGMFWFSRKYLDVWSSLVSAIILSFGGYMIGAVYMGHTETVAAMAWLPIVLGSLDRFVAEPKRKYFFLMTIALAMQILAGTYIAVLFTLELISLFYLFKVITVWIPTKAKQPIIWMAGFLVLAILLAAGISAVELVPFWENAREGIRAAGLPFEIAARDSFNWNLFTIFYTSLSAKDKIVLDPIQNITLGSNVNFEYLFFLGFSSLGLIGFSFLSEGYRLIRTITLRHRPEGRVTGVGGPPTLLRRLVIGFGRARKGFTPRALRSGGRHLAGPARDTVSLQKVHPIWIFTILAALVFFALAFGKNFFLYHILYIVFPAYQMVRRPVRHLMIVAFCAAFLGGWGAERLKYRVLRILAVVLVGFELVRFGQAYIRVNPEPYALNDGEMISWLKDHIGMGRIHLNFRNPGMTGIIFYEDAGSYYRLPLVNGYSPMVLDRYYAFTRSASLIEGAALTKIFPLKLDSPVINYLSVKYVIDETVRDGDRDDRTIPAYFRPVYVNESITVYENPKAFPHFFLVGEVGSPANDTDVLRVIQSGKVDLAKVVIMTKTEAGRVIARLKEMGREDCDKHAPIGTVAVNEYRGNDFTVAVSAACPAALVTSEPYFPGWEATIDGQQTPIFLANYAFRSIIVPKGEHTVIFSYNPKIFLYGGAVSVVSSIVFLLVLSRWKHILSKVPMWEIR